MKAKLETQRTLLKDIKMQRFTVDIYMSDNG